MRSEAILTKRFKLQRRPLHRNRQAERSTVKHPANRVNRRAPFGEKTSA